MGKQSEAGSAQAVVGPVVIADRAKRSTCSFMGSQHGSGPSKSERFSFGQKDGITSPGSFALLGEMEKFAGEVRASSECQKK